MDDLHATPEAPATPTETLTLAAGQAACVPLDLAANAATAADLVRRAADRGADLLHLPELFLTGYELSGIVADPAHHTTGADDPRLDPLREACATHRTALVVGAPTRTDDGALHISALAFDRDGKLAATYDKQHATPGERATGIAPGAAGCTLLLDGWRLGISICWDSSFSEHARAAALDGCHVYLNGSMFSAEFVAKSNTFLLPARALDNTVYVSLANHSGPSGGYLGGGHSAVWGPQGELLDDAGEADPGLAVAVLDPAALLAAREEEPVLVDPSLSAPVRPRIVSGAL
ncbi:carbon-nitrogen hydrolase family protein [Streptacidiphilus fuscans]|uniref:Carbon-nitrogen hydrolase family protein n=1 Tax=Streptacidiphilus fuscans TaxID=2789292 RepID=A0A931FGC6_9ACTN|nr:carbon-nitrogen hydrolase family protein [Streptacidiphilus fuscans]MBF9073772.1 carbon-nitrogen hydrolase family protein [Streptacidiphilus fuscans]